MLKQDPNPICSTTTTTVQICKIRGFSLDILGELYSKNVLTTPEIASALDCKVPYARVYLHRLYQYGCIERKANWGWIIEPLGTDVLLLNNNNIDNRKITERTQKDNRKITETSHDLRTTVESRQLNLEPFLQQQDDLSDDQRVVVVAIANHYEKTGRPYLIVKNYYEFAEQVGLSERMDDEDIQDLVISLDVAGIIYTFKKGRYLKIGLLKDVVSNLQYC